jgi:hypothetical protein
MTQDHGRGELEPGVAAADEPDVPPASAELRADISDSWSWASAAAGIPQVGRIEVRLSETVGRALLVVRVVDEDREIGSTVVHDGRLEAGEHEFGSRTVPLAAAYMARLDERGAAKDFDLLEEVLGAPLPAAARAGTSLRHDPHEPLRAAVAEAGFCPTAVDLVEEKVTFTRVGRPAIGDEVEA